MSQLLRQQIAQKQAELAELERQASILEKVEDFQTFRDLADTKPTYPKILNWIKEIKEQTLFHRPEHPDYINIPTIGTFISLFHHGEYGGYRGLYKEEWLDEIFDLIIYTERDENWIRDFKIIKGKLLDAMRKMNDGWKY